MSKLFHLSIGYVGKPVGANDIQKVLGSAGWARYAPNSWIVETSELPSDLVERIRKVCGNQDSIFVCELNIANCYGYLQKEIWDWINERKLR